MQTPLKETDVTAVHKIGLIPILRAGLGMVEGVWNFMPSAEVWHIGIYRDEKTLKPVQYYNKLPIEPTVSVCLILDPMLATGGSAAATVDILKQWGVKRIKFVGLWPPGRYCVFQNSHPDVPIHLAAVDKRLKETVIYYRVGRCWRRQFGICLGYYPPICIMQRPVELYAGDACPSAFNKTAFSGSGTNILPLRDCFPQGISISLSRQAASCRRPLNAGGYIYHRILTDGEINR